MEQVIITSQYGNIVLSWPAFLLFTGLAMIVGTIFVMILIWSIYTEGKFDN